MKTYTFAAADASVQEHMRGLVKALGAWLISEQNKLDRSTSGSDIPYLRGRVDAYREIMEIINDSNSI